LILYATISTKSTIRLKLVLGSRISEMDILRGYAKIAYCFFFFVPADVFPFAGSS
jgi:hypothetical protein